MATSRKQKQQQLSSTFASPIYTVVLVTLALSAGFFHIANAQQDYNNVNGYTCNGQRKTCTTYAIYRTQNDSETFASVGTLFNLTAADVAKDSGKSLTTTALPSQTPLYIRLACGCSNGTYFRSVGHKVVPNDTYSIISQVTYESLTTYQAMEAANPTVPATQIQIGSTLNVPLRCACPTASQATNGGTTLLLTYVIYPQETLAAIASHFNVTTDVIQAANNLTSSTQLDAYTTLLVPFATLPALSSVNLNSTGSGSTGSPPSTAPAPSPLSNGGAMKLATATVPLCLVSIGIGALGAAAFGF